MHILVADLDDDDKLDMIPSRQRLLFDIIRMIAYRAETRMIPALAQMQGKKTNARKLLSAVMASDADILPDLDMQSCGCACLVSVAIVATVHLKCSLTNSTKRIPSFPEPTCAWSTKFQILQPESIKLFRSMSGSLRLAHMR